MDRQEAHLLGKQRPSHPASSSHLTPLSRFGAGRSGARLWYFPLHTNRGDGCPRYTTVTSLPRPRGVFREHPRLGMTPGREGGATNDRPGSPLTAPQPYVSLSSTARGNSPGPVPHVV